MLNNLIAIVLAMHRSEYVPVRTLECFFRPAGFPGMMRGMGRKVGAEGKLNLAYDRPAGNVSKKWGAATVTPQNFNFHKSNFYCVSACDRGSLDQPRICKQDEENRLVAGLSN